MMLEEIDKSPAGPREPRELRELRPRSTSFEELLCALRICGIANILKHQSNGLSGW